jgi:thiol-disulfide isomerase/thioredoxin
MSSVILNTQQWLKARTRLWSFMLLVSLSACSSVSPDALLLVGQPVPDGRLMLMRGDDIALKNTQGRHRAILFWATWCAHSRSVISQFEDLARTYASRGDTDFFAVNLDRNEDIAGVKERIEAQDLTTVTHVFSGNDVQDEAFLALKGDHVPYSVFVDRDAIVRYVGLGVGGLEDFFEQRREAADKRALEEYPG